MGLRSFTHELTHKIEKSSSGWLRTSNDHSTTALLCGHRTQKIYNPGKSFFLLCKEAAFQDIQHLETIMPFTVTFTEPGFIHAVYEGELNMKGIQEMMSGAAQAMLEHACFLVLSDYRKASLAVSITDLYELPKLIMKRGKEMGLSPYKIKRALVIPTQAYDNFHFFETVSLNNSQNVRIFTDEEKAMEWLFEK
jgi:hypothetical protein